MYRCTNMTCERIKQCATAQNYKYPDRKYIPSVTNGFFNCVGWSQLYAKGVKLIDDRKSWDKYK
jgi:hypothetical protein